MGKTRTLLRVLRAKQSPPLSQRQVALKLGMHRLRYWGIENGEIEPTSDEKNAVAAVFSVKASDIEWPELTAVAS